MALEPVTLDPVQAQVAPAKATPETRNTAAILVLPNRAESIDRVFLLLFGMLGAIGEKLTNGGWTESLTHMTVGQVRRVWIPEELAYGGAAGMPAGMLVFDIELIAIE